MKKLSKQRSKASEEFEEQSPSLEADLYSAPMEGAVFSGLLGVDLEDDEDDVFYDAIDNDETPAPKTMKKKEENND